MIEAAGIITEIREEIKKTRIDISLELLNNKLREDMGIYYSTNN